MAAAAAAPAAPSSGDRQQLGGGDGGDRATANVGCDRCEGGAGGAQQIHKSAPANTKTRGEKKPKYQMSSAASCFAYLSVSLNTFARMQVVQNAIGLRMQRG